MIITIKSFIIWLIFLHFINGFRIFPKKFKFGVASSAYQIEGAWNENGKNLSIWDTYFHKFPFLDNGDIACNSYHKYLEDVEMIKNLEVQYYRFSLSWSRLLPNGTINYISRAGINYYENLIYALKSKGIEPVITLYHWDLPQNLQDKFGGWPNPELENYFVEYARLAFLLFGHIVKVWSTFNEPKQTCWGGYGIGVLAPAIKNSGIGEYLCAHTIIKSHARVYHLYDKEFRPQQNGKISIVIDTDWYEPGSNDPKDIEAAERKIQFNFGWFANPIFHPKGNYPQVMIDRIAKRSKLENFTHSRLPKFTNEEINYIRGTYDYIGLNTYTTTMVQHEDESPIGAPSYFKDISVRTFQKAEWEGSASFWLKVAPFGIRKLLNWVKKNYNHPEIIITENGYSDFGGLYDYKRVNYLKLYFNEILNAIYIDEVNVTAYTVWSLMDNLEWIFGYREKFGLYAVDFNSPNRTRTIKRSGIFYKFLAKTKILI